MTRTLRMLAARLHDERGMALVLAIVVSSILAIAGASLVLYSISNEHHASRSRTDVRAYNLAQTGIEKAVAQIAAVGDTDGDGADDPDDPAIFTNLSATAKTETFGSGESTVWDAQLWNDRTGALYVPQGPFYIPALRWHVTATSTVPNPAVPGGTMTRQLQSDVLLAPERHQEPASEAWRFIFSKRDDGDPPWRSPSTYVPADCDIILPNNPNVAASFYVTGDLCLENNSQIIGGGTDPTEVIVHGWIYNVSPQAWVGTVANPTDTRTSIGGMCVHRNRSPKDPFDQAPGPPQGCWFSEHFVPDAIDNPPVISPPTVTPADFDAWYQVLGSPGPNNPCDIVSGTPPTFDAGPPGSPTARDNSNPTIDLLNHPGFQCETLMGKFNWDPSSTPKRLTVEGTVYIDGGIDLFSTVGALDIEYDGVGSLYTSGSIRLHQVRLCAYTASGPDCDTSWDGQGPMLLLVSDGSTNWAGCNSCGILLETSSAFQGAMYTTHNIGLQNLSMVQGPMVADAEIIANQFTFYPIPLLTQVPFGTPQTPIINWDILPPTNYKG